MLGLAVGAIAPPAAVDGERRRAAIRAEAMLGVPVQHRLAFGDRRQMVGVDQTLHGDGAQIGDQKIVAGLERLRGVWRDAESKVTGFVEVAEENSFGGRRQSARFCQCEQRIAERLALFGNDHFAADHIGAGFGAGQHGIQCGGVAAALGGAFETVFGIAEAGLWSEVGARGHARRKVAR